MRFLQEELESSISVWNCSDHWRKKNSPWASTCSKVRQRQLVTSLALGMYCKLCDGHMITYSSKKDVKCLSSRMTWCLISFCYLLPDGFRQYPIRSCVINVGRTFSYLFPLASASLFMLMGHGTYCNLLQILSRLFWFCFQTSLPWCR